VVEKLREINSCFEKLTYLKELRGKLEFSKDRLKGLMKQIKRNQSISQT